MIYDSPQYRIMGDRSLLVELGDDVSRDVNRRVRKLCFGLELGQVAAVTELLPGYRSLMVIYDPLKIALPALKVKIEGVFRCIDQFEAPAPNELKVPVVYGGEFGPDLEWVANHHNIPQQKVIHHHCAVAYQVYMIGFTPGYPYMGELPDELVTPRRDTPRVRIPQGSVGIAQKQTGIYPVESPGGWQIIGRTPLKLFDPDQKPPSLLQSGDLVTFYPIQEEEFSGWKAKKPSK